MLMIVLGCGSIVTEVFVKPICRDLIFTNEECMIQNISYQAPLWSKTAESDHLVIVFDFICYLESTGEQPHGLNFRKANFKIYF